jgi:transposase
LIPNAAARATASSAFYAKLEQFRRFATGYDKLAKTLLAAVHLAAPSSSLKICEQNLAW